MGNSLRRKEDGANARAQACCVGDSLEVIADRWRTWTPLQPLLRMVAPAAGTTYLPLHAGDWANVHAARWDACARQTIWTSPAVTYRCVTVSWLHSATIRLTTSSCFSVRNFSFVTLRHHTTLLRHFS